MEALPEPSRDAMRLLPDVWSVLLDPSKKVIDDSCLEKFLSWMVELTDSPAALENLLSETCDVAGFLQKSLDANCNSATQVFALRLSSVLLNSLNEISVEAHRPCRPSNGSQVGLRAGKSPGLHSDADELRCKYRGAIGRLAGQHLLAAVRSTGWQKASVRNAWFESARVLVSCKCPSDVIQKQGMLDVSLQCLEDSCLFVIAAAQRLLADLITAMYTCSNPPPSSLDSKSTEPTISRQHKVDTPGKQATARSEHRSNESTHQEPQRKRSKAECSDAESVQQRRCDCRCYLQTCLRRMTDVMTPAKLGLSRLAAHNRLRASTLGVWSALLETRPLIANAVLTDVNVPSIMSGLLQERSHTSYDVCTAVVDFTSSFLRARDSDVHVGSELVADVMEFPGKLMNIHQFRAAIHLASNLFSTTQTAEAKGRAYRFLQSTEDGASLMRLVMLPVDCLHIPSERRPTAPASSPPRSVYADGLLEEMTRSKCRCLQLVCHSLAAVQRMVDGGLYHIMKRHTDLVDQTSYILSLTLGQRSHEVTADSLTRRHLQGSIKVTKAALALAKATAASTSQGVCHSTLPDSSLMALFSQLNAVLTNPESDPTVISKCLDVVGLLLSTCSVRLKQMQLLQTLAETVAKRLCDQRWAVRDSAVGFLQTLLTSPTGELRSWFQHHKLHVRILECVHDGESFVRATAMNALVDVSKQGELWKDLLQCTEKSEIALVGEFVRLLDDDSPGFLRRATVHSFTRWLKVFAWLQTGRPGRLRHPTGEAAVGRPQTKIVDESSTALQIWSAVSRAMFDLDWEVKHGALMFWQTLLEMYNPAKVNDASCRETDQEVVPNTHGRHLGEVTESHDDEPATPMFEYLQFLKVDVPFGQLLEVLHDEDPTVARRACQLLLDICNSLPTRREIGEIADPELVTFLEKLREQLEMMNLQEMSDQKTNLMHTNGKNPLSLLTDILTGTEDDDCKFVDCY